MVAAKRLKSRAAGRGGQRANAGRPPKLDKDLWGKVTCILRHDTIARLREGADSRFFGEFLQDHLDRYPVPTRDQYLLMQRRGIPVPRPKVVQPWNDHRLSADERFKAWIEHEREKKDKQDERDRAAFVAMGLSEAEIDRRRALGPHANDEPRKTRPRKPLAHSKR